MTARTVADLTPDDLGAFVRVPAYARHSGGPGEPVAGWLYGLHDEFGDGWRHRRLVLVSADSTEEHRPEFEAYGWRDRSPETTARVIVTDEPPPACCTSVIGPPCAHRQAPDGSVLEPGQ